MSKTTIALEITLTQLKLLQQLTDNKMEDLFTYDRGDHGAEYEIEQHLALCRTLGLEEEALQWEQMIKDNPVEEV